MNLALIQARMGSTRLPGKVLKPLAGLPAIHHVIARVRQAKTVDEVMVVTSIEPANLPLFHYVTGIDTCVFVGSEDDVLDRFWQATRLTHAKNIIRITADCPVMDPVMIDRVVELHRESGAAYTSNTEPPTWPDGLDVEVMQREALQDAWANAETTHDREHVTPFIRGNNSRFVRQNLASDVDLSEHRWTLDQDEDYRFLSAVIDALYSDNPFFGMQDILRLVNEDSTLTAINNSIERNAGSKKPPNEE
jgi:spore coat polysaccharide biosynthesis protein SpsF